MFIKEFILILLNFFFPSAVCLTCKSVFDMCDICETNLDSCKTCSDGFTLSLDSATGKSSCKPCDVQFAGCTSCSRSSSECTKCGNDNSGNQLYLLVDGTSQTCSPCNLDQMKKITSSEGSKLLKITN